MLVISFICAYIVGFCLFVWLSFVGYGRDQILGLKQARQVLQQWALSTYSHGL